MNPFEIYPLPVIIIDYALAIIMWTLLGRGVLDLFISPEKNFVMTKVFRQVTNPVIRAFDKITPKFLIPFLIPFYVAWWFFVVRFYLIPYIYVGVMGTLSLPIQ